MLPLAQQQRITNTSNKSRVLLPKAGKIHLIYYNIFIQYFRPILHHKYHNVAFVLS